MKNKNFIAILLLVIISITSVFSVLYKRNASERKNNTVEFIVEYSEVEQLYNNSDLSILEWLQEFKDMGVMSVALGEQTLLSYITEYNINYDSYSELKNRGLNIFDKYDDLKDYNDNSLILYVVDEARAKFISQSLDFYEDIEHKLILGDKTNYLIINQDKKDILLEETGDIFNKIGKNTGTGKQFFGAEVLNVPIGFDDYKVNVIKEVGLDVVLRPLNYEFDPKGAWELYLSEVETHGINSSLFFPYGDQLIGYDAEGTYLDTVYQYVVDNNLNFVIVETIEQREHFELDGYDKFLPRINKDKIVRLFNTWPFISNRYEYLNFYKGSEEISNSYYRAITERNIRGLYLRPFSSENIRIVTDPEEYQKMLDNLVPRLEKHGYSLGNSTTFEEFEVSTTMKIFLTIQIGAYIILLLNYVLLPIKAKYNAILLALGSGGVVLAYYIAPNMATTISAFLSTIVFSCLAVAIFMKKCLIDNENNSILKAGLYTLLCGFIAMLGGFYVGSIMSTTDFILEFGYFRGVKVSVLLPILVAGVFAIIFYVKEIYSQKGNGFFSELSKTTKDFLDINIKVKYLLMLGVLGVLGLVYIARGSNTSNVDPLAIELIMRNFLENNLLARPRTKEFLIAFPLMTFSAYYVGNKYFYKNTTENAIYFKYGYVLFFGLVSAVGLSSITNTFSHIRTPIYISFYRTIYGLVLGVIIGYIYIVGFKVLVIIFNKCSKVFKKFVNDFLA